MELADIAAIVKQVGADKPKQTVPVTASHVGYEIQYLSIAGMWKWLDEAFQPKTFRDALEIKRRHEEHFPLDKYRIVAIVEVN